MYKSLAILLAIFKIIKNIFHKIPFMLRKHCIFSLFYVFFYKLLFVFSGVLACLDGYMNIALDQTEEYVNGQLKNKYGDAFIRGNNVLYISTQKRRV